MELKPGEWPDHLREGPPFVLTTFPAPHRWATRGDHGSHPWSWVAERVSEPDLWPGTGTVLAASHRLPAWTFARFRDDTRVVTRDEDLAARQTCARVESVHGLMVEYVDEPAADGSTLLHWWGSYAFIAYTTGFHELEMEDRPPGPRWRVLLPFAYPVDREVAQEVAEWAMHPRHGVGIVAEETREVWRVVPTPALGPGGYRWLGNAGAVLDPRAAVRALHAWRELDRKVRAEQTLEGTHLAEAVDRLRERRKRPILRPRFPVPPIPGLKDLLGELWPGRMVALMGVGGSGRTTLALQFARASLEAGLPVLLVLTRMGKDEALARMLAMGTGVPARTLLDGGGDVDRALDDLRIRGETVHLWTPPSAERHLKALSEMVRATSRAHGGGPVLIVVDGIEGWAVDDPQRGARSLISGLRDASHTGTLSSDWPGAAVLFVSGLPRGQLGFERLLARAREGLVELGPFQEDASAVVLTSIQGKEARLIVAKNRDGSTGVLQLDFDPSAGFVAPGTDR